MTSVIDQIDRALDMAATIVKNITRDQLAAPSPCDGWDVRMELNHLVGGMRIFAAELAGTAAGAGHDADWLGEDPQDAYTAAADLDRAAWHRPGVLSGSVVLGFGAVPVPMAAQIHLTEVLGHSTDLAFATGQEALADGQLCEELLTMLHGVDFSSFRRPGMFGPEVTIAPGAPASRRLLAFLGRDLGPR